MKNSEKSFYRGGLLLLQRPRQPRRCLFQPLGVQVVEGGTQMPCGIRAVARRGEGTALVLHSFGAGCCSCFTAMR